MAPVSLYYWLPAGAPVGVRRVAVSGTVLEPLWFSVKRPPDKAESLVASGFFVGWFICCETLFRSRFGFLTL